MRAPSGAVSRSAVTTATATASQSTPAPQYSTSPRGPDRRRSARGRADLHRPATQPAGRSPPPRRGPEAPPGSRRAPCRPTTNGMIRPRATVGARPSRPSTSSHSTKARPMISSSCATRRLTKRSVSLAQLRVLHRVEDAQDHVEPGDAEQQHAPQGTPIPAGHPSPSPGVRGEMPNPKVVPRRVHLPDRTRSQDG